jgi:phosphoserine phosphatase
VTTSGPPDPAPSSETGPVPLVVDLDGTLLVGDSLKRMLALMARRRPHRAVQAFWLKRRGGKPAFKLHAWRHSRIRPEGLRRRAELMAWLEEQAGAGRPVYLATGAPEDFALELVSDHDFFAGVFGTTAERNLTGPAKARLLVQRFGERGFDYVGNSAADVEVWRVARRAVVCGDSPRITALANEVCEVEREFA